MRGFMDIGSTMIKAVVRGERGIVSHEFTRRDYGLPVAEQAAAVAAGLAQRHGGLRLRICSSANGGIRVGLASLTRRFSGAVARNTVLSAGANLVFHEDLDGQVLEGERGPVDLMVLVGGAEQADMPRLRERVEDLDPGRWEFGRLVYAGNGHLFELLRARCPSVVPAANVLGTGLAASGAGLTAVIRGAYLEDLVDRQGMREVQPLSEVPIWPTPGVVNLAFEAVARRECGLTYPDPFIVLDVGGATTDLHYGRELVADTGDARADGLGSTNRHVFTDLGVFASRDSATARLLAHERLYDFLEALYGPEASLRYAQFRDEGVPDEVLPAACFFLSMDAAARGVLGMPRLDLERLEAVVLTGGVSQTADSGLLGRLADLFLPPMRRGGLEIEVDNDYRFWLHGMERVPLLEDAGTGSGLDAG